MTRLSYIGKTNPSSLACHWRPLNSEVCPSQGLVISGVSVTNSGEGKRPKSYIVAILAFLFF